MSTRDPMMHIRVPRNLKDWAAAEAASSHRSLNAQIVYSLEREMLRAEAGSAGEAAAGNPDRF